MNCFEQKPKDGYGFIYKYTSPSGKSYIGQTSKSLKERAKNTGIGYLNCSIFYNAINKYGFENFNYEILEEVNLSDIDEKEKYYIKKYDTVQPKGYNCYPGGKNDYSHRRNKTSQVVKYDSLGNFIKIYNSVNEAAEDARCTYQTIVSVLTKVRTHHKGFIYRYLGEDQPEPIKVKQTHGRLVGQYTLDGEYLNKYPSANEAARAIGKDANAGRNIRSVCTGKRNMAYGFVWKYLE